MFLVSLSWIPAGNAEAAQPHRPSDAAMTRSAGFPALLADRSARLMQNPGSIADSAHTRSPGIDVRELSEARAAPSAVAFSEADLFGRAIGLERAVSRGGGLAGDGSPGAQTRSPLRAGTSPFQTMAAGGQPGMPVEHGLGESDMVIASPSDGEGIARYANDAARRGPNASMGEMPLPQAASVDAGSGRKPVLMIGGPSGVTNRIAAPPDAAARSSGGTPPEVAARRFQFVGQLLPVNVTVHPGSQGMQVTARVGHIEAGDEVELERLVETTLASDGFSLGEMTLNGRRSGGKTGA